MITIIVSLLTITGAVAQTSENFNSLPGTGLTQVKAFLQTHCWQFHDFDINSGWDPAIEGDGAMVSKPTATSTQNTGIYSPQLSSGGSITVSFKYKFSAMVTDRRWFKIYITDGNNNIAGLLDNVELTGDNNTEVYTYNKTLSAGGSGCYKIYINYQGIDGDNRIAIDDIHFSANTCSVGGCNRPPVAINDFIAGANDHTASGDVVLPNDYDPDGNAVFASLITNSPDGNVVLNSFGNFTFTPNAGFTGPSTSFTYIVCDNNGLCSDVATVLITFQTNGLSPALIADFGAVYANDKVNVKWTTTFELNNDHFEVERSTDGINFKLADTLKGQGSSTVKHEYQFNDDISKNVLNKNDIYYRLKQVDAAGKSVYTKVLVVRVYRTKTLQSLSVTPNPAINDIKVNVQLNENAYIVLKVANSSGIEVVRKTTRGSNGSNTFTLEGTNRLQAGVYFLEMIVNSNERMNVKLIKS